MLFIKHIRYIAEDQLLKSIVIVQSLSFKIYQQGLLMAFSVIAIYSDKKLLKQLLYSIFCISIGTIINYICLLLGVELQALGLSLIFVLFDIIEVNQSLVIKGTWLNIVDDGAINILTRGSKNITSRAAIFFKYLSVG